MGSSSCKKDNDKIKVKGTITEPDGTPVPYADVFLMSQPFNCFTCQYGVVQHVTTNVSGSYSIDFGDEKGVCYDLKATKEHYFDSELGKASVTESGIVDIYVRPEAFLKLHVKNTSLYDVSDYMGFTPFVNSYSYSFYGNVVDTIIIGKVIGNSNTNLYWAVRKNNITNNHSATVYCPKFDTTTYNINY